MEKYIQERHRIRGDWRTHPPHRKCEQEQGFRLTRLAYGLACLLTRMDEKQKEFHDLLHRMRNTEDELSELGYYEAHSLVSHFADELEEIIDANK